MSTDASVAVPATAVSIVPIPAFADNYIWALVHRGHCVVVDPGDAAPVEAFLAERQLTLDAILITHHHADHVGGVASLASSRPDLPVYGPAAEAIAGVTHPLIDGDTVNLPMMPNIFWQVMSIPGHTRGHIAYFGDDMLFCGDTLFAAGCGRLFEGTPAQMHASLTRLASLPASTRVFCTHEYTLANLRFALAVEPDNDALIARSFTEQDRRARGEPTLPSTVVLERETNPFLRVTTPQVIASAVARARDLPDAPALIASDPEAVFAVLRQWKNDFR
ncbi:hydroxyacylglutathione hydrolase [Casimicrobium huifangae]|uniref:hydroxyacylglutathione hydrolase n=1 Tax=Casimicrobium huifangae TaxID=2591109 RepID=UPI0037832B81